MRPHGHTLRYYERIGLLDPPARAIGNQRRYDDRDMAWLEFLQRLRATGMPIRTMRHFADLRRGGEATVSARRALLEQHRDDVLERISLLHEDLRVLDEKINTYREMERRDAHE